MDEKNRHKFNRHFKTKDSEYRKKSDQKISDDDRKVPPLKIKPIFMKPSEKKPCKSPTSDTPVFKPNETSTSSKSLIEDIHSKNLSVAVQRMEPHIVKKYTGTELNSVTKSNPDEASSQNLKRASQGQTIPPIAQPVGKLVLKLKTEKKSQKENSVVWK
jgi:hypothetical protein